MRLIYIFAAVLAVTVAESDNEKAYADLVAMETMELKKEGQDLTPAASAYNYPNQGQNWNNLPGYHPSVPVQPVHNYVPQVTASPPYYPPVTASPPYVPPVTASPPYVPPVTASPPYVPPVSSSPAYVPPVQSDYVAPPHHHTWSPPHYHVPTTTTPIPVIKNEYSIGDNGSYKYEYEIADGTHVGEEGYFTDPKATDESLVKRGWYSYVGADGKTYTVKYYADKTGFHAYGDHLPTPPPIPPAIQAALDKEEAEKNKPTYPPQTQYPHHNQGYNPPQQGYYPPQQSYNPPQQTYYPPQQTYYPHHQ